MQAPKRRSGLPCGFAFQKNFAWLACRSLDLFRLTRLREKGRDAIVQREFHPQSGVLL